MQIQLEGRRRRQEERTVGNAVVDRERGVGDMMENVGGYGPPVICKGGEEAAPSVPRRVF
jgi:hypothetical protein